MNNQKKAHRYTIVFIYMFFTIVPIVKSATKLSGNVTNLDGTNLNEGIFNITNCAIVCPFPQQTIKYTLIANGKFELYLNSGYYQAFISTKEEKYTGFFPLIIQEDDKNIKIKVRLTTIHPQPLVNLPQVKFVKGKKNHQEIYDLCNSIRDYQRSVFTEIDNKNLSAPEKYLIPIKNLLISKFQLTDNPALCEYSALLLTELHSIYYYPSQEINLDSSIVAQILAKLSPANSSWSLTHFSTFSEFIERNQIKNTFFLIDKFFQENSDRTIKSQALFKLAQYFQDINDIEKNRYYYDKIKSDYDDMTQLLPFLPEINPYRKIKMGNPLPEFSLRLIDSKNLITNSDLKGKIVLIDLWSTTCHGCVYEMPLLHKIYEKYQNNNFTILSIACGDTKKSVTEFRNKKWKMPWLNSWDENGWMSEPAKIFEMNIQPKHILIDTNGIIVAEGSKMFGENLEKIIDSYFESILDQSK